MSDEERSTDQEPPPSNRQRRKQARETDGRAGIAAFRAGQVRWRSQLAAEQMMPEVARFQQRIESALYHAVRMWAAADGVLEHLAMEGTAVVVQPTSDETTRVTQIATEAREHVWRLGALADPMAVASAIREIETFNTEAAEAFCERMPTGRRTATVHHFSASTNAIESTARVLGLDQSPREQWDAKIHQGVATRVMAADRAIDLFLRHVAFMDEWHERLERASQHPSRSPIERDILIHAAAGVRNVGLHLHIFGNFLGPYLSPSVLNAAIGQRLEERAEDVVGWVVRADAARHQGLDDCVVTALATQPVARDDLASLDLMLTNGGSGRPAVTRALFLAYARTAPHRAIKIATPLAKQGVIALEDIAVCLEGDTTASSRLEVLTVIGRLSEPPATDRDAASPLRDGRDRQGDISIRNTRRVR